MSDYDEPFDDDIEWVSKSEMKREMHKWQALGERLLAVKKTDLKEFPLNEEMLAAIDEAKRIKSHEAMRRHLQYIGKLIRNHDVDAIQAAFDKRDPSSDLYLRYQNQAEQWRERLLKDSKAEGEWFEQFPDTDRQPFRSLVRAAKKEQPDDTSAPVSSGKNSTKLLKWIRTQLIG